MSEPYPHTACQPVTENDTYAWLALYRTPGIGSRGLLKLLAQVGSPTTLLKAGREQLKGLGLPDNSIEYLQSPDESSIDSDLAWLACSGNGLINIQDSAYPPLLATLSDPPLLLFTHGDPEYLRQPQLAIVGSRNPSRDGSEIAEDFATWLGHHGLTICSGLATGIDAAAHRGALNTMAGTVAVTGTGLDRVYPARHRDLAHRIAENGVLVSEFPPGTPPLPANFPRRNRIISGLSLGTLVVEAALRSGSLITARQALEQGREVFALPGSIHNPLARGCHALIRDGAKLVEKGEHILEELASQLPLSCRDDKTPSKAPADTQTPAELPREYRELLDCMGYDTVSVDQLVQRSGLTPEQVSSMLLLLELEDSVHSGAGGRYTRAR